MFERTRSGQANRATLLGVQAICYVEGRDNAAGGADILFWQKTFQRLRPDMKVRFLARGGKPILESLAADIIDKDIPHTYVAIDADYDHQFSHAISDRRILYTFGYSIENDLFCLANMYQIFAGLAHMVETPRHAKARLRTEVSRLETELRLGVYADVLALQARSSVLPRDAPGRVISCDPATLLPTVRKIEVLKLCAAANARTSGRGKISLPTRMNVSQTCVGHVFRFAMAHILRAVLREFGKRSNYSSDHIRDMALQTFANILGGREAVALHHRRQFANL